MCEMKKRIHPTAGGGIKQMQSEIKLQYYTSMLHKKMKEDMERQKKAKTERKMRQVKHAGGKRPINEGKRKRADPRHTKAEREKHIMTMMTPHREWDAKKYGSLETRIPHPMGSEKREILVRPF